MNIFKLFLTLLPIISFSLFLHTTPCKAQLSTTFYASTCPNAPTIIRNSIRRAISAERRMAASLIRLHFHDCFVQGCDASILLDETSTIQSEKTAAPNANSARGFNVIEAAKRDVERACPGVVSCADILTLAARDASVAVGGPSWNVRLGRRDSTTASRSAANTDLPSPFAGLDALVKAFGDKGLSARDMVALSGAHTLGQAQCFLFRGRIYSNGTDIDAGFASTRQRQCPQSGGDANLAPLDLVTPNSFDNNYFRNLVQRKGLLQSDQVLFTGSTAAIVNQYSRNPRTFAADFAAAMIKMSEIQPLLGQNGIIRRVGGPSWNVRLGRRDSTTASRSAANTDLPSPFAGLDALVKAFGDKGLSARDMVALSGSHTLGQARCFLFRGRIYSNGTDIDAGFARRRQRQCPQSGGDANLAPLDLVTPNSFDNNYFRNLVQRKGLLQSDQVLFTGSTAAIVNQYSGNPRTFAADFAAAMIKMSEIQPLLGQNGIIRRVCSAIN